MQILILYVNIIHDYIAYHWFHAIEYELIQSYA
jgi:hypothetical protein